MLRLRQLLERHVARQALSHALRLTNAPKPVPISCGRSSRNDDTTAISRISPVSAGVTLKVSPLMSKLNMVAARSRRQTTGPGTEHAGRPLPCRPPACPRRGTGRWQVVQTSRRCRPRDSHSPVVRRASPQAAAQAPPLPQAQAGAERRRRRIGSSEGAGVVGPPMHKGRDARHDPVGACASRREATRGLASRTRRSRMCTFYRL